MDEETRAELDLLRGALKEVVAVMEEQVGVLSVQRHIIQRLVWHVTNHSQYDKDDAGKDLYSLMINMNDMMAKHYFGVDGRPRPEWGGPEAGDGWKYEPFPQIAED